MSKSSQPPALRADSTAAHPGQLLRLFWSSTCHSCSKNMGRWREICLVKQITKKKIFQTLAPILIHFFALTEWFSKGRVLVGLGMEFWDCGFQELFPPKITHKRCMQVMGTHPAQPPLPEHSSSPQPRQGPVRATHSINSQHFCNCVTIHINLLIIFGEKKQTVFGRTHPPVKAVHALPKSREEPSLLEVKHLNTV